MNRTVARGLMAVFLVTLPLGCAKRDSHREAPPNVILIIMDTVRADHLGCYGYDIATSPHIDRFAGKATLYERAVASSSWSIPSHASIFCGKDPFQHGAHRSKVDHETVINPLHFGNVTLAEMFVEAGYSTGAIVANDGFLSPRWQLDQGFETYNDELAYGDVINQRVFAWLDSIPAGPFFLVVNYMDAHKPYNTAPRPGLLETPAEQDDRLARRLLSTNLTRHIPQDIAQKVRDQYDTGIANLDEHMGALFDYLLARGLLNSSVVVLTADHGEAFGEHRMVFHGNDVYEPEVWVPLIVRAPGQREPLRIPEPVSISDIPRIILGHMGKHMEEKYAAEFPNAPGDHPVISENYYSLKVAHATRNREDRIRRAIYDWPYKYIYSSVGESELYDLADDPSETHDLVTEQPDVAARLAKQLEDYIATRGMAADLADQPDLTPEEIEKLKALGYIGN